VPDQTFRAQVVDDPGRHLQDARGLRDGHGPSS
jgi:hypothetical protein